MLPDDTHFITDEANLRAPYPQPMLRATGKVGELDHFVRTADAEQHPLVSAIRPPFRARIQVASA